MAARVISSVSEKSAALRMDLDPNGKIYGSRCVSSRRQCGGHRRFRPSVLAKELRQYDVVNVGAAGTFVVRKPVSRVKLRAALRRKLPFEAEVALCDGRDLIRLEGESPFAVDRPRAGRGSIRRHPLENRSGSALPANHPTCRRAMARATHRIARLLCLRGVPPAHADHRVPGPDR